MKPYPLDISATLEGLLSAFRFISRERANDIQDFNNLQNIFMSGRKVGKIPASSVDVAADDHIGDFNITKDFRYDCVSDGAGGAVWRRIAEATW